MNTEGMPLRSHCLQWLLDCTGLQRRSRTRPAARLFASSPRHLADRQENAMISSLGLRYRGQTFGNAPACACHSRRAFLTGAAAIGAAAVLSPAVARAEPASALHTVDVHHHIYPPRYLSREFRADPQRPRPLCLQSPRIGRRSSASRENGPGWGRDGHQLDDQPRCLVRRWRRGARPGARMQ